MLSVLLISSVMQAAPTMAVAELKWADATSTKVTRVITEQFLEKPAAGTYLLVGPSAHQLKVKVDLVKAHDGVFHVEFVPVGPMWAFCELEATHHFVVIGPLASVTTAERVEYLGLATAGGDPYLPPESPALAPPTGVTPSYVAALDRGGSRELLLDLSSPSPRLYAHDAGKPWQRR